MTRATSDRELQLSILTGKTIELIHEELYKEIEMAKTDEPKKYTYVVKSGRTFGASGQYPAGSEVELTEAEAAGFADLLERKDRKPMRLKNELDMHLPPEYRVLRETSNPASDTDQEDTPEEDEFQSEEVTDEDEAKSPKSSSKSKSAASKKHSSDDKPPKGSTGGFGVG